MPSDPAPREHDHDPNDEPAAAARHVLGGRVLTIGRSKKADIRLRDGRLSRKHCQLIPIGDGYMVADLDSQNGTKVNGKEVRKHVLKPGDFLELGGFRLDFIGDSLLVTQGESLSRPRTTSGTHTIAPALIETAHPEMPERAEPALPYGPFLPPQYGPVLPAGHAAASVVVPEQYGPVQPEAPAASEPPPLSEDAGRLADYLRDLGADEALLAKAFAHLGQPASKPAGSPKPTSGTSSISTSTAAVVVEPPAPQTAAEPQTATDELTELPVISHAAAAAAPAAGLVMAPPAGHEAADLLGDTTKIRVVNRARVMRRLVAAARVRGGSIGVAVAAHAALLAILSLVVVAASVLQQGEPTEISLPETFDASFEKPDPPPELPAMPAAVRESAERELAVAVERGANLRFGDWSKADGPGLTEADPAAPISAGNARFADTTSRVRASDVKVPALFANRFGEARERALRGHKKIQPAVERALGWLASQQRADGSWSAGESGGQHAYDVGVTALAVLAFVGAGEGGRDSRYGRNVARALVALRNVQQDDGWIGMRRGKSIYNHLAATQAALEAWHVTRRPAARMIARQGLKALEQARVSGQGWRYRADRGDADTALTSWSGSLIAIASRTGEKPHPEALPTAIRWVRRTYDPSTGRIGYQRRGDSGARFKDALARYPSAGAMSGSGAFMLLMCGYPVADETITGALTHVMQRTAAAEAKDVYAWHWNALALHQAGGKAWEQFAAFMEARLLPLQAGPGAGADAGSFSDDDPWAAAGGRVYTTAMAALALESHYRYARVKDLE